ncbi:hypothetical protein D3C84_1216180 [compost metagenome]
MPQFNVIQPHTVGYAEEVQAAKNLTDAELREKILEKQRLNAYGRKGGYGATLLHSAAYLKVLYTEWRRRELRS